ncbi:MAG TPA: MBL fold metallo-hydrolase [Acidimicrobiales bacterium]|nr:MBL fold metallo-hydrolase [Acidimicrobiales bacterium]
MNERVYLVDCGSGVARQLARCGLLLRLHQVFVTHLHSDHACDFFNLFLLSWPYLQHRATAVEAWGPGPAGGPSALPSEDPGDRPVPLVSPSNPCPGLVSMTNSQVEAHAYDINVRTREAGRAELSTLMALHEIAIPDHVGANPPEQVAPPMEPFLVAEDDAVRVTAILVEHPPVFPAFAYRFDTESGSVVMSGDTAPCTNLLRLARGADILVHEVVDDDFMRERAGPSPRSQASLRHVLRSHTSVHDVGTVAAQAGVRTLVLTHFIPSVDGIPDEHWSACARAGFDGRVVVGRDLLEIEL